MSGEAWAAVVLLLFVLGVLLIVFGALRLHYLDQQRRDGGRALDRAEGTHWFEDPERIQRLREQVEERQNGNGPPEPQDEPHPPRRPSKNVYGKRVQGGDDG